MSSLLTNKINKVDRYIIDELIKEEKGSLYEEIKREWYFHWFQYIKDNPNEDWDYDGLSENPNITWEIVQANPTKPWDYDDLSENPNITCEIVQANQHKPWDYKNLSYNPMTKGKNDFISIPPTMHLLIQ